MFAIRKISCTLACLVFTACQTYLAKPLDPQSTAVGFSNRSLDDSGLRAALASSGYSPASKSWPPSPWRLRELQGTALHFHPDIAVAKAQAASSLAAVTTADSAPNLGLNFNPERGSPGAGISPWVLGFSLDYTIETAGKRTQRTRQARATANATVLGISDKAWTVVSAVRSSLLELEANTKRLEVLESQRENDETLVAIVAKKVQAGESPRTDLGIYQTQQSRNLVDLADGRSKSDAARAKLADAIGLPASALRSAKISFGPLDGLTENPNTASLRKAALLRRPELLGLLETYAATDAALRLEIAKQYPDVRLNPGYTFDQGQKKWALGIGLTLPIDRNIGPIREAIAKRDEAAAIFERAQIRIRGELDQALAAYKADRARLRAVDQLLANQQLQLNQAQKLSKAGEADHIGELTARSLVFQAQLARIDALLQAQQSLGKLEDSAQMNL